MTKQCNKCKEIKDTSKFYIRRARGRMIKDSYRYVCKICDNRFSAERRKARGWDYDSNRYGKDSKHAKDAKKNSQRHRDELSDMYMRGLIVKKTKGLKPEDIPIDLVKAYRVNLMLKRKLNLTNKKENK